MALFLALTVQAFVRQGIGMWSVGIVYILYDTALLLFTARWIWCLTAEDPPALAGRGPDLTVIVAAHNEAAVLAFTVSALAGQESPPECILIADDGSTDGTAAVMRAQFGLEPPEPGCMSAPAPQLPALRWLRLPHGGKARALNRAIDHVETEMMITVDADTLLAPGAIRAMRAAFAADEGLVAATGVLVPACGPHAMGRVFQWFQRYEYVRNFLSRRAWMQLDALLLISGAFAAFRTVPVRTVGGFDPACMVEDYELIHRLHRHAHDHGLGWRVSVVGGAVATTDAPASPLAFLRQRQRWFGGFLQTQHWNRDMVGNRRYGWLGTAMLPVKALDTLQPIYGLTAFVILVALLATGNLRLTLAIIAIMVAKVVVDVAFHLWSLKRYAAWTGQSEGLASGPALLASFIEPFTFQLLRHSGAAWGWIAFLTGKESWHRQHRTHIAGLAEATEAAQTAMEPLEQPEPVRVRA